MSNHDFGLSNIYLKFGAAFLIVSTVTLIFSLVVPSMGNFSSGQAAGFFLFAGVVFYVIGRIIQAQRRRTQA